LRARSIGSAGNLVRTPGLSVCLALLVLSAPLSFSRAEAGVVISEIHYHPPRPDGSRHEFVELHNPDPVEIPVEGWRFEGGIRFTFPEGAAIPAGGHLVVSADSGAFDTDPELGASAFLLGDFSGSLANQGDHLVLRDDVDAEVDALRYGDSAPWPLGADGQGFSLNRVCVSASSQDPSNWEDGAPTPAASSGRESCPLPPPPPPTVVISEIFYHPPLEEHGNPAGVEDRAEFVEIQNVLGVPVDVGGWKFTDGIEFTIPEGTELAAGEFLIVAREPDLVQRKFAEATEDNTLGPFVGQLSNSGERITLSDGGSAIIDSVEYRDVGDWPYAADGEGRSLERVTADGPSYEPSTWASSRFVRDEFRTFVVEGFAGPGADGNLGTLGLDATIFMSLDGPGEAVIDNFAIEELEEDGEPGTNVLVNGHFDDGLNGWTKSGNSLPSVWDSAGGEGVNNGALRLISNTPCPLEGCDGTRTLHGLKQILSPFSVSKSTRYRISFDAKSVSGSFKIHAGFTHGTQVRTAIATPGAENSVRAQGDFPGRPPSVRSLGRFPRRPRSDDQVFITARFDAGDAEPMDTTVKLVYGFGELAGDIVLDQEAVMVDDGTVMDGLAGDGVFGAMLNAVPHNSQVRFRIHVEESGVVRTVSPLPLDPDVFRSREVWGYYVTDEQPESSLPAFDILIDGADGTDFIAVDLALDCRALTIGSVAVDGDLYPDIGLRFRGNTACFINKRNFKLRFNRGRMFDNVGNCRLKKLNLNGLWTDKAIIREDLAWDFHRQVGAPFMDTFYARMNVNGVYFGLFMSIVHPDNCFLDRNNLDPDGNLYKSVQPPFLVLQQENGVRLQESGQYPLGWEEETNRGGDYLDIEEFVGLMHNDSFGGPTREFYETRTDPDMILRFQLANILLQNIDSSKKNHFLYHDLIGDKWGMVNWDVDLTFGKFFWPQAVDINPQNLFEGRQVGTLNDYLRSEVNEADHVHRLFLHPWTMTSIDLPEKPNNEATNNLVDFFFLAGDGYFQRAYLVRFWDLLMEKYRRSVYDDIIDERLDSLRQEIEEDYALWGRFPTNFMDPDTNEPRPDDLDTNVDLMKEEIAKARSYLIGQMETLEDPEILDHPRLKITEIMFYPELGDTQRQYLEMVNTTGREIDISGWTIEGIGWEFPIGSLIEESGVVVVARSPALFEALYPDGPVKHLFGPFLGTLDPEGELLRVRDAGPGGTYPATIDFLRFGVGDEWPSVRPGFSIELRDVSWDLDNDFGHVWQHSEVVGGSPGFVDSLPFIRGDANGDQAVDLSDSLKVLSFLFLGASVSCSDAVDVDDSGLLDITDPIYLLTFLFLGGLDISAPYPEAGEDPTQDDLTCGYLGL
jgi:hypothetical protein